MKFKKIKQLISDGEIETAIEKLHVLVDSTDTQINLILALVEWNRINNDLLLNIVKYEDATRVRTRICKYLLETTFNLEMRNELIPSENLPEINDESKRIDFLKEDEILIHLLINFFVEYPDWKFSLKKIVKETQKREGFDKIPKFPLQKIEDVLKGLARQGIIEKKWDENGYYVYGNKNYKDK